MKLKINTKIIKALNPCQDRFDNWTKHYSAYDDTGKFRTDYTAKQFLNLKNITHKDKLWVVLRLVSNETKVIFALDCAFNAYAAYAVADTAAEAAYATADTTAYAAEAAADTADTAAYAAEAAAYAAKAADAYANADTAADTAYAAYAAEAAYAAADTAAAAADTAAAAAYAAAAYAYAYANARKTEESRQIEALIYLIEEDGI